MIFVGTMSHARSKKNKSCQTEAKFANELNLHVWIDISLRFVCQKLPFTLLDTRNICS